LQCSTCRKWHTCRFCHDEAEDHILIRRETNNMLCMHCGKAQPAQQDCRHCGVKGARYYCDINGELNYADRCNYRWLAAIYTYSNPVSITSCTYTIGLL